MSDDKSYYEDLRPFALSDEDRETLLATQGECSFCWTTKDGAPMSVIMGYVWHEGRVWLTATSQRLRIKALRRDPRCAVVVTSTGVNLPPARTVTIKGTCTIHEDAETKAWFYPKMAARVVPQPGPHRDAFEKHLDSPMRVVLEVEPTMWLTCDAAQMMAESFKDLGV